MTVVLSLGAGPWRCHVELGGKLPRADVAVPQPAAPAPPPPTLAPPPAQPRIQPPFEPPAVTGPVRREEPTARESYGRSPPRPTLRRSYPEQVIVSALRLGQSAFAACWKRAQRHDPTLLSMKVRVALEIDSFGEVKSARTDAEDAKLSACLAMVARRLPFPPLGDPVALDLPLFF